VTAAKQPFSWMNPKLEIKRTSKYGKGVFAKEAIKNGSILFVMGGYILTIEDENNLQGVVADKPIEISEWFSIGPRKPSDLPRMPQHYVNHSCRPNAGFQGQIFMVATRKVRGGEEIAYDYAMVMHSNKKSDTYFKIKCLCGTRKCRGYITEDDWRISELQKKYDGYFQWFIQEKINRIKMRRR
jgi:hypothetical protein